MHVLHARPGAPKVDIQDVLPIKEQRLSHNVAGPTAMSSSSGNPTEKKLTRLRKKLQQIEVLKKRKEDGGKLESSQVRLVLVLVLVLCVAFVQIDKLKTELDVLEEISLLEELLAKA